MHVNGKRVGLSAIAVLILAVAFQNCSGDFSSLTQSMLGLNSSHLFGIVAPGANSTKVFFIPNQGAGTAWMPPGNGHVEGSFSDMSLWPNLQASLAGNSGGFGIYSAELAFTSPTTINNLRQAGLTIDVEPPGMTQCWDGKTIADVELNGRSPAGANYFCSVFKICSPTDRIDPNGRGWFYTSDGQGFIPDEIAVDERFPGKLPYFDAGALLDGSKSWADRKNAARRDDCTQADSFNAPADRVTGLAGDYVEYIQAVKAKWPTTTPRVSMYWVVHPGWEWGDEQCLDALNAKYPNIADFTHAFQYLTDPCYRDSRILQQVIQGMCNAGSCPETVYFDVDIVYNSAYTIEALRRDKQVLANLGVGFGLILDDPGSTAPSPTLAADISSDGNSMIFVDRSSSSVNARNQEGMLNLATFLHSKGILDGNTRMHIQSYVNTPVERGNQVSENVAGSLAQTADRMFSEQLVPWNLAVGTGPVRRQSSSGTGVQRVGFFQINHAGGLLYSNGTDAYCGVPSWDAFLAMGGKADMSNVNQAAALPTAMRADPPCQVSSAAPPVAAPPTTNHVSGTVQAEGFFQINHAGGLLYSNGSSAYCGVPSWDAFLAMGGKADMSNVKQASALPTAMHADPPCSYTPKPQPAGFFQIGTTGGILFSNGNDAYCGIPSWDAFIAMGGKANMSNVAHIPALPAGMRHDPDCR